MKVAILTLTFLLGNIFGAVAAWEVCDQGGCWTDSAEAGQPAATPTSTPATQAVAQTTPAGSNTIAAVTPRSCTPPSPTASPTPTQPTPVATVTTDEIVGLAIIGDSTADEYRVDNPRGGEFGETTFNWVELLVRGRDVNLGVWGSRPEPRRGGYEYNWARSAATSEMMIRDGQHTGVARQIAAGRVSHVILQIGINDFFLSDKALAIYDGTLTDDKLQDFLDSVIANIDLAVSTLSSAGDATIILAATQDYLSTAIQPELRDTPTDEAGLQRLIDAFAGVNRGLQEVAERHQVQYFDFNAALQQELERRYDPADPRYLLVGGERIDLVAKGNEPHHSFLGDDYSHPGTVLSALMANLFIQALDDAGNVEITPFTDAEILRLAGIR